MKHFCPKCGHEIKFKGELEGPVQHLPHGAHKYRPTSRPSARKKEFK